MSANVPSIPNLPTLEEVRTEKARRSLRSFVEQAWPIVEPGAVFTPGWHIDCICEHLEAVTNGDISELLINMPPRHMKSTSVSVFWPVWEWINDPTVRWVFNSYSDTLSIRDSVKCRHVIQHEWYRKRWGHVYKLTSDQNVKSRYENDKTGYRIATSVTGGNTGEGGNRIVVDDPLNVIDADSEIKRAEVLRWWFEVMPTRINDWFLGRKVIVMQRAHYQDLSGAILDRQDMHHLCLPAEWEPRVQIVMGSGRRNIPQPHDDCPIYADPRTEPGELLWPSKWPKEAIDSWKMQLGPYSCTPYESPILMSDLSTKPIGEIKIGDEVVGFDVNTNFDSATNKYNRRHLVKSKIKNIFKYHAPIVKLTLSTGHTARCTIDHKWYGGRGDKKRAIYHTAQVGTVVRRVCDPQLPTLTVEDQRLAGWVAGFFDGEGTASITRMRRNGHPGTTRLTFSQGADRNLPLCEKLEYALSRLGFDYSMSEMQLGGRTHHDTTIPMRTYSLTGKQFSVYQRFIHLIQPTKWRQRIIDAAYGAKFMNGKEYVVSIEPDGEEDVYALETETGNYVVWGLLSSNSHGQLQQRPTPREGVLFKVSMFRPLPLDFDTPDIDGHTTRQTLTVGTAVDLAWSEKESADNTASVTAGIDKSGNIFLLNAWRVKADEVKLATELAHHLNATNPSIAGIEQSSYTKTATIDLIRRINQLLAHGIPILSIPVKGDKYTRAQLPAGRGQVGMLYADTNAPWWPAFLSELLDFPKGAHDDWVDALSLVVQLLVEKVGVKPLPRNSEYGFNEAQAKRRNNWVTSAIANQDIKILRRGVREDDDSPPGV